MIASSVTLATSRSSSVSRLVFQLPRANHPNETSATRFFASTQNALPVSTTCAFVKPAAMSVATNPRFGCPAYGVKPSAILPPGFMTRHISRKPATASGQTCIELIASALSKLLSSNGKLSTEPHRRSTCPLRRPGVFLARACSTISRD
jgi:hypothetical protein